MKALHFIEANHLEWREIADATIQHITDAIIKPLAVAACDLDRNIVTGRSPFPGPFVLGHEFCGEVIEVGEAVHDIQPGSIVLASFQPSCGTCIPCNAGHSSVCGEVANTSMYGIGAAGGDWSGALADLIRVPWADYNLLPISADIKPGLIASGSDNLADGLRAVDLPLAENPGGSVFVAGQGSIALYTILCAKFLGSEEVTFASRDKVALSIAERLGANCLEVMDWPKKFTSHDITMDCTNDSKGLNSVIRTTAPYGHCTSASIYFTPTTPVPMLDMYMKGIHLHTGRVNSASQLQRVLELVTKGLDPEKIEPSVYAMDDAVDALFSVPISKKLVLIR